eukprot:6532376-Prymnesium_polylepis.1
MHMLSIPQRAQNEQKHTKHTPSREIMIINANGTWQASGGPKRPHSSPWASPPAGVGVGSN